MGVEHSDNGNEKVSSILRSWDCRMWMGCDDPSTAGFECREGGSQVRTW